MVFDFDPDYIFRSITKNGEKHYFATVRRTGETVEISKKVINLFWADDRKAYRDSEEEAPLSLDTTRSDEWDSWLDDHLVGMSEIETPPEESEFQKMLTPKQLDIYKSCVIGDCGIREYAKRMGVNHKIIVRQIEAIRKIFLKYFFEQGPKR